MKKGEKKIKLFHSYCVDPLYFGWLGRSTWQMALTNSLCEVHKRRSGISFGMNSKRCTDGSEWLKHKKKTNAISFGCETRNVARALNYFKHTYPSRITAVQVVKPLGYNLSFISMVGSSVSRIDPSISQIRHVKMQALIIDHLISKIWGGIYS